MSDDLNTWYMYLEKVAWIEVGLSMLSCIGIANGYNVSLALFVLYNAYSRNGRINATSGAILSFSLIIDITLLSLHGSDWSAMHHEYTFAMAMMIIGITLLFIVYTLYYIMIIGMFVKCAAILLQFLIYGELGSDFQSYDMSSSSSHAYSVPPHTIHVHGKSLEQDEAEHIGTNINKKIGSYQDDSL